MNPTENLPVGAIYSPVNVTSTLQSLLNSKLTRAHVHHCKLPPAPRFWSGNSCFPQTMKLSLEKVK